MDREDPNKGDVTHLLTQRQDGVLHRSSCLVTRNVATCKHSLVTHASALWPQHIRNGFSTQPH